jgi:hypothetical protein
MLAAPSASGALFITLRGRLGAKLVLDRLARGGVAVGR